MPNSIKVVTVFEDSTKRRATSTYHFESTNSIGDVQAAARDVVKKMDNMSDALFVGANLIVPINFSWFQALGLKTAALECDVENKARFQFVSGQNDPFSVEVPCPKNAVIDDQSNLIDDTHADVLPFINAILTNGWVDGAVNLNATDQQGNALVRLDSAEQKFRKSRKRRSGR